MRTLALSLPLVLALSACGAEPEPAPTPTPTPTSVGPRTLVSSGFSDQMLGPKIVGPEGAEVEGTLVLDGRTIAEVVSYVACPALGEGDDVAEECVPEDQPDGAIYTYVHRVTPVEIDDADDAPLAFRTTRAAPGFAKNIGYDRIQAEAALGEDYSIRVQEDNGQLVWRMEVSDGWDAGEEITFFWQSELPPEGPAQAYAIETGNGRAEGSGPFPPDEPDEGEESGVQAEGAG